MQKRGNTTIKDIAEYAGVSIATVSRYMNKSKPVNNETAERIQSAITHFGYIPNDNARALRSKNDRTIGLILPDIANSFFSKVFKLLETILFDERIFVLVCNSDESKEKEKEYLYRLLQRRVDAIIIAPTGMNDDLLREINQTTPIIIFDRKQKDMPSDQLSANDEESAELLTHYLLKNGHRRIAYTMGVPNSNVSQSRMNGFIKATSQYDIESSNHIILHDQDEITCRKKFHELLLQDQTTAIVITSPKKLNWFLIEYNQLYIKGIRPNLSFVGYATQSEFDISYIPLTGMLQKEDLYAAELAKMVFKRLNKPYAKPNNKEIRLTFKSGKSVNKICL